MPRRKILTQDMIDTANELKKQGLKRKEIASYLKVSYGTIARLFGPERLGIDRSNKIPWTIENLKKLEDNYKTMPIYDLCFMFNRDKGEIRQLLFHLGWEIPKSFIPQEKEKVVNDILNLSKKYNQREISKILGIAQSSVQAICQENQIQCVKTRNNIAREQKEKEEREKQLKPTPEKQFKELLRTQADEIKKKLNKTYSKGK